MFALSGKQAAPGYLDAREFTKPMFVFVVMVIAASRPVTGIAQDLVRLASALVPLRRELRFFFVAFFLGGLVVLAGQQDWRLRPPLRAWRLIRSRIG